MAIILYVNGDSHTAAAEAVNPHGFAEDDSRYRHLGRRPHPDNLRVSWGQQLADSMGGQLVCQAESASSNHRISRTTLQYILDQMNDKRDIPDFVIIGWSTWERREWLHDGVSWQISAGGVGDDWPDAVKHAYRDWVLNIDYNLCMREAQKSIYELHLDLRLLNVKHLFFNTFLPLSNVEHLDWLGSYIAPYDADLTFYNWCRAQGFQPVYPGSYHFGADAHAAWARFLEPYLTALVLSE